MEVATGQVYNLPSDAVWFITGCSSGIGKALAQLIAEKGQRLVATARKVSDLSYLPSPESNPNILTLVVDVTSKASINAAVDAALARFGRLDVVVNNAGYTLRGDTENAPDADSRRMFDTNFWGTVDLSKRAVGVLRDTNPGAGQRGGVILNVTSMGGRAAFAGNSFYHASKFAVEGFTESFARELRPEWNVHFSLIEPGAVKTGYFGRSMVGIPPHPAYADPDTPARVLERYTSDPSSQDNFADASAVAEAMYKIVGSGKQIPLRVPLGPDAWAVLKSENEKNGKELDAWKDFSIAVGKEGQSDSVKFLM